MMQWCAYCQEFQDEIEPYDSYEISHGMCEKCSVGGLAMDDRRFAKVLELKKILSRLLAAGANQERAEVERAVDHALNCGARPVDVLLGIVTPMLWQIGHLWECGKISVADEHRITSFYEGVLKRVEAHEPLDSPSPLPADILLFNGQGNIHTLATRVLHLKFRSEGLSCSLMKGWPKTSEIVDQIAKLKPRFIGISIATVEQGPSVLHLREQLVLRLGVAACPPIIIGGNAVKRGFELKANGVILGLKLSEVTALIKAGRAEARNAKVGS